MMRFTAKDIIEAGRRFSIPGAHEAERVYVADNDHMIRLRAEDVREVELRRDPHPPVAWMRQQRKKSDWRTPKIGGK